MKAKIFVKPIEVGNRLEEIFGFKSSDLREVIDTMIRARNSCTDNDPPSAAGFKAWSDGTRRLREVGAPLGWERNNDNFVYSIHSPDRQIKIAVCNTDDSTGIEDAEPQNRNKKGAAMGWAVSANQMTLALDIENVVQLDRTPSGVRYWYLCVYIEGEVMRAELSCPSECDGGFFKSFEERIILIGGDNGDGGVRVRRQSPDGGSDEEIIVTRKQA
jgi:hypothetical protein